MTKVEDINDACSMKYTRIFDREIVDIYGSCRDIATITEGIRKTLLSWEKAGNFCEADDNQCRKRSDWHKVVKAEVQRKVGRVPRR